LDSKPWFHRENLSKRTIKFFSLKCVFESHSAIGVQHRQELKVVFLEN
jgi:hypothetical protein